MALVNQSTGEIVAESVTEANNFWLRFKGLMFTANMTEGSALYLSPCRSIHTFFMRYPIDVLYLNTKHEVVAVDYELEPNKIGSIHNGIKEIIELPAGTIKKASIKVGQVIKKV